MEGGDTHPGAHGEGKRARPAWPLCSRPQATLGKLPPTPALNLPAPGPTSPARGKHSIPASCGCCVQAKFSKLNLGLGCPRSHPPASSEASRRLGVPLPDPPLPRGPSSHVPHFLAFRPGRLAGQAINCIGAAWGPVTEQLCPGPCSRHLARLPGRPALALRSPPSLLPSLWRDAFALTSTASSSKAHRSHMGTPARCHSR